jgi:hypothetical protein
VQRPVYTLSPKIRDCVKTLFLDRHPVMVLNTGPRLPVQAGSRKAFKFNILDPNFRPGPSRLGLGRGAGKNDKK